MATFAEIPHEGREEHERRKSKLKSGRFVSGCPLFVVNKKLGRASCGKRSENVSYFRGFVPSKAHLSFQPYGEIVFGKIPHVRSE
jgi:hypothetical protein